MTTLAGSSFRQRPVTRLGRWALGFAVTYVVMFFINTTVFMPMSQGEFNPWWRTALLPFYGIAMMLSGMAAGVLGLVALIRNRERSWLVWFALLPGASALIFLLGEFLIPH